MAKKNTDVAKNEKKGSRLWLIPAVIFSLVTAIILFFFLAILVQTEAGFVEYVELFFVILVPLGGLTALFYWLACRKKKQK